MIETKNLRKSYYHQYRKYVTNPISNCRLYLEIVGGLMQYMMKKVLEGNDVDLGSANTLGTMGVRGNRQEIRINEETGEVRGLMPNWPQTKKLWDSDPEAKAARSLIYHLNEHSNGIRYHFVWHTTDMKVQNRSLYTLTFCKANRKALTKLILQGKEYIVNVKRYKHEQQATISSD